MRPVPLNEGAVGRHHLTVAERCMVIRTYNFVLKAARAGTWKGTAPTAQVVADILGLPQPTVAAIVKDARDHGGKLSDATGAPGVALSHPHAEEVRGVVVRYWRERELEARSVAVAQLVAEVKEVTGKVVKEKAMKAMIKRFGFILADNKAKEATPAVARRAQYLRRRLANRSASASAAPKRPEVWIDEHVLMVPPGAPGVAVSKTSRRLVLLGAGVLKAAAGGAVSATWLRSSVDAFYAAANPKPKKRRVVGAGAAAAAGVGAGVAAGAAVGAAAGAGPAPPASGLSSVVVAGNTDDGAMPVSISVAGAGAGPGAGALAPGIGAAPSTAAPSTLAVAAPPPPAPDAGAVGTGAGASAGVGVGVGVGAAGAGAGAGAGASAAGGSGAGAAPVVGGDAEPHSGGDMLVSPTAFLSWFRAVCAHAAADHGPCVIMLDGARWHLTEHTPTPTHLSSKDEYVAWLTKHGIEHTVELTRPELYELVNRYKADHRDFEISHIARASGHEVLILPAYHPELQVLDNVWNKVAPALLDGGKLFTNAPAAVMEHAKKVAATSVTPSTWADARMGVIREEDKFWAHVDDSVFEDEAADVLEEAALQ